MLTNASNDENSLLMLVASSNRQASGQFYTAYTKQLYPNIFLFTHSMEDSEELLQEIFMKVWVQLEKRTQINNIRDYLFKMAKNKLLDNIRHHPIRVPKHQKTVKYIRLHLCLFSLIKPRWY
ncbi:MAG: sigma factor [Bacteroidota bacterium]